MEENNLLRTGSCLKEAQVKKLDSRLVQHQIEIEDTEIKFKQHIQEDEKIFEHSNYWVSCCLKMDKRAVAYFSQLLISVGICGFTVAMMAVNQDCATFSRYSPLLTLVVGVWLPSPRLKND